MCALMRFAVIDLFAMLNRYRYDNGVLRIEMSAK